MAKFVEFYHKISIVDPDTKEVVIEGIFKTISACFLWLHLFEMSEKRRFDYYFTDLEKNYFSEV